jgi:ATP phosphoribosyltransferase regulatory subunit
MEFENTLLAGSGGDLSHKTFRVMDPLSQQMMGFRADITHQIGRIALSRLTKSPHPIRLCYAGRVLLVKAEALRSERQLYQTGFELIGTDSWEADAEVMMLAVESLKRVGVTPVTLDINIPVLVKRLLAEESLGYADSAALKEAISKKDINSIPMAVKDREAVRALLNASGPADHALSVLREKNMPEYVKGFLPDLMRIIERLSSQLPDTAITIDPLESRGHEYYSGFSFSVFAQGLRHELGRGGRYQLFSDAHEPWDATGYTLYITHLMRLVPNDMRPARIALPASLTPDAIAKWQDDGYITILAHEKQLNEIWAKTQGCRYWLDNGNMKEI